MPYEGTSLLGYYFRVEESAGVFEFEASAIEIAVCSLSQTVNSYYRPICCLDNRLERVAP